MSDQLGLTDEQHAIRKRGLGGSDIAALLGLDPYRGPWDVFADKSGRAEPFAGNRFTRWGNRLEAVIAAEYAESRKVYPRRSKTLISRRKPWVVGTPDRLVAERLAGKAINGLEIKARGHRQSWKWGEESAGAAGVPDEVQAQCHWYMALTELPVWDVAVLLDGNDFRVYRLTRDAEIENAMMDVGEKFWRDHVEKDVPPAFDGGDAAWSYLRTRLAGAEKRSIEPTPEVEALAVELERAQVDIADAERRKATIRQQLSDLAAGLGVRGFKCPEWSFSAVEQRGRTNYKTVATALYERLQLAADERTQIEEACRGRAFVAPRFTSKRIATKDED